MPSPFTVVDLFSGAGGMSCGFARHPAFRLVAAYDGEFGKPSGGGGSLGCNRSYAENIGLKPTFRDLTQIGDEEIRALGGPIDVLSACPPCTGFSRALPRNHLADDLRNAHVPRTARWVEILQPRVLVMENARELLTGRFSHHFAHLERRMTELGYRVHAAVHRLDALGLPQRRERALVLASREPLHTLEELWSGWRVRPEALTVRHAIGRLPPVAAGATAGADPWHRAPGLSALSLERLRAIPRDGGSWLDLRDHPDAARLLTPAMQRALAERRLGDHPDVYGRLAWDRPAVTIKRECAHVGNGRYSHPEQDRLCTVRELGLLQGFPTDYRFGGGSLSNMYRHIGDAVPPLVSHQLAHLIAWILGGPRPTPRDCVLPGASLEPEDILPA